MIGVVDLLSCDFIGPSCGDSLLHMQGEAALPVIDSKWVWPFSIVGVL